MSNEPKTPISLEDLDRAPATLPQKADGALDHAELHKRYVELVQRIGEVSTRSAQLEDELREERQKNTTRAILDELIKPFAHKVFGFMCCYASVVGCLLFYHGLNLGFTLPEAVLNYMVGSTAVTVLGLVGTVLTGIFVGARK